jgi:hypothetical protein
MVKTFHREEDLDIGTLIELLKSQPLGVTTTTRTDINTFVVNLLAFDYAINEVYQMVLSSRYAQSELDKHLSNYEIKLYYFLMVTFWICRNMREHGQASISQCDFVDFIERAYPLESLPIDGVMRLWFVALAPVQPSNPQFKPVVPIIPPLDDDTYTLKSSNYFTYRDELVTRLPGIEQLFRALNRVQLGQDRIYTWTADLWSLDRISAEHGENGTFSSTNRMRKFQFFTPGIIQPERFGDSCNNYRRNPLRTEFPTSSNTDPIDSEIKLFRLNRFEKWLPSTLGKMKMFCRYISGSCSLADVSNKSLGVGLIEIGTYTKSSFQSQFFRRHRDAVKWPTVPEQDAKEKDTEFDARMKTYEREHAAAQNEFRTNVWKELGEIFPKWFELKGQLFMREREIPNDNMEAAWMTNLNSSNPLRMMYEKLGLDISEMKDWKSGPYWNLYPIEQSTVENSLTDTFRNAIYDPKIRIVKPRR